MKKRTSKPSGEPYWYSKGWEGPKLEDQTVRDTQFSRVYYRTLVKRESLVINLECGHRHWLGAGAKLRKDGTYACVECNLTDEERKIFYDDDFKYLTLD